MKKKHFVKFLAIIFLTSFSCFSAQDMADESPFRVDLSKIDWNSRASVDLAISFLKFPETDVVKRFDIFCKISTSPDLTAHRKEIISYRQQIIEAMLDHMKSPKFDSYKHAYSAYKFLQQPWLASFYKREDFMPIVIGLIINGTLNCPNRAIIVDSLLDYSTMNYNLLTHYHKDFAPAAIELMQDEQVDVDMRANIAYKFLSHRALSGYNQQIAPALTKLMQDERVDINTRATIAYRFLSCRVLPGCDVEIAPVAIELMENGKVVGEMRANIACSLLQVPGIDKFYQLILPIAIEILNEKGINSHNKARIANDLLSISNLNNFYQIIQPIALKLLKEQQQLPERGSKIDEEKVSLINWMKTFGTYVDCSELAVDESYQTILKGTIEALDKPKLNESVDKTELNESVLYDSYQAIMPFAVKLLLETDIEGFTKSALGFTISSITHVPNPEGIGPYKDVPNMVRNKKYSYLDDFFKILQELNRISKAKRVHSAIELGVIRGAARTWKDRSTMELPGTAPNSKVQSQQASAASSSSNARSQQASAAGSSLPVNKRSKGISFANYVSQSKQTDTSAN